MSPKSSEQLAWKLLTLLSLPVLAEEALAEDVGGCPSRDAAAPPACGCLTAACCRSRPCPQILDHPYNPCGRHHGDSRVSVGLAGR